MSLQIDADVPNCSECGAFSYDGLTCPERLHRILALEKTYPELQALHFLTVAVYNIQHPAQFMPEAIEGLRRFFAEYLDKQITIDEIKRRNREFNGEKSVLKPFSERHTVLRIWQMTTADVYLPIQAQGTAERVRKWAESVKSEL